MNNSIVFYDGDCGLCQRSIAILNTLDTKKILYFAPLNGLTYKKFISNEQANMESVLFYHNGYIYNESDAILSALVSLNGWKRIFLIFRIIPRFIRDAIYKIISNNRKKVSCVILNKDHRFLN